MYASSTPASLLPSASPSSSDVPPFIGNYFRPITSCLPCRRRKVKCDRRQPICFTCERGNHACSYVSAHQPSALASEPSRVTKSTATKMSSPTLTRTNPRLQRLADILAQAQSYEAFEQSSSLPESYPTIPSPALPGDVAGPQRQSQEDVLILENGVPRFISGKHWAWMAEEVRRIMNPYPCGKRNVREDELISNHSPNRFKISNLCSRSCKSPRPKRSQTTI